MARLIRLDDARADIRERANNQRATDATINRALNQYIAELYDMLVLAFGDQYFKAPDPLVITTVANTAQYPIDDGFYKVLGVWWERGTNDHVEILPYEQNKARGPVRNFGWNRFMGRVYYRVEGTVIRFQPPPLDTHTVLVDYIPPAVSLVADSDTFDGYNGWELYPIYRTAAELARDESEFELSDRLEAKAETMKRRIQEMADRDQANAPRIALRRAREWRGTLDEDEEGLAFR